MWKGVAGGLDAVPKFNFLNIMVTLVYTRCSSATGAGVVGNSDPREKEICFYESIVQRSRTVSSCDFGYYKFTHLGASGLMTYASRV